LDDVFCFARIARTCGRKNAVADGSGVNENTSPRRVPLAAPVQRKLFGGAGLCRLGLVEGGFFGGQAV
jgi:hypothetical protein